MGRPAPRGKSLPERRASQAVAAVALVAAVLAAGLSLTLDAVLAARLGATLAGQPMPANGGTITLRGLGRWECRALTGGLWMLPLRPRLDRLALPPGTRARPAGGTCRPHGPAPVILTRPASPGG